MRSMVVHHLNLPYSHKDVLTVSPSTLGVIPTLADAKDKRVSSLLLSIAPLSGTGALPLLSLLHMVTSNRVRMNVCL